MSKRFWQCSALAGVLGLALVAQGAIAESNDLVAPRYGAWGFDLAGRDSRVKPGDDFYRYSEGLAVDRITIPPDRPSYGNYEVLEELSQRRVHAILEDAAAARTPISTREAKMAAFYKAFMNEALVERLGTTPLEPDLAAVRAAQSKDGLASLMGEVNRGVMQSLFTVDIQPDAKDPKRNAVLIGQGGLGLPDRDDYLLPQFAAKKAAYQSYVSGVLAAARWPQPAEAAQAIVRFETELAKGSWAREATREADKMYNPTDLSGLKTLAPGFPWEPFLAAAQLRAVERFIVTEKSAFPRLAAVYAATPLATLKAWQAFHVADTAAPYLSASMVNAHFSFFDRTLMGQQELAPRWKRAVATVSAGMGEAIGEDYVARYFPPQSKTMVERLVANLKVAFRARLEKLTWMSQPTKAEALAKLAGCTVKIGYPNKWRDYSALEIRPDDLLGDVRRSAAFEWNYRVAQLRQPVDREAWQMTPQTVDAYSNPFLNEIVFSAAVLQPPFFDPNADPAINYGAIGGVIGHEITHGFDDQGRKFDAQGRLRDWWTGQDAASFEKQAKRLGAQYSRFEPVPGVHVNGDLTMGENIADLGGLTVALDAYHTSLQGKPAPLIDALTGDQRVFLGWAQVWGGKKLDEEVRQQVLVDEHSPWPFRTNGVVRNIDAWYEAFGIKPGDHLYLAPPERVHIW